MQSHLRAAVAAVALAGLTAAHAAPVGTNANIDFDGGSVSFGYLGSQFTLTDVGGNAFTASPVAVTTGAGAAVSALPAVFGGAPNSYFDPVRGGALIFDGGSTYSSFTNTPIPFSVGATFIGLALTLDDGVHYGFARFAGTNLLTYAFESVAGVGIAASSAVFAVPEPTTWALMLGGLGVVGAIARRRKASSTTAA